MHSLAGVDAKIGRGFDHLDEFEVEASAFLARDPYEIRHDHIDGDTGMRIGVFHIREEPPLLLGIIAGEAIGQFRWALDHLMDKLVRLVVPAIDQAPNFPIHPTDLWQPPSGKDGKRGEFEPLLRPEHLALVDTLQSRRRAAGPAFPRGPFSSGFLSVVQWFTNMDKHEVIHPVFATPRRIAFDHDPNVRAYIGILAPPFTLEEGTKLYLVDFVDESAMHVPLDFVVDLAFGPPPMVRIDLTVLRSFGKRIAAIVEDFRGTTPEFAP
jgi:hypothetical protein